MGPSSGDKEAGFTVGLEVERISSSTKVCSELVWLASSETPKSCCDNVTLSRSGSSGEDERVTTPEFRRKRLSSSTSIKLAFWALMSSSSSCWLRCSRASTSRRLRSLDDWAARRFLRTRSTRRCSFSSSVLARFLMMKVSDHV